MSIPLERSLNKIKTEGEEVIRRISDLSHNLEYSDITLQQKSLFSKEFSKLANDVTTLNEIILNTITHDNVDLESYVVAPDRIADLGVRN